MRPLVPDDVFRRLCRARDVLHRHQHHAPALTDLARAAGMSRFHFLRQFREVFGSTPRQYLIDLRLQKARALLAAGDMPVTQVCLEVGFTSVGSFSTLFSKRVGVSPQQWRRRIWQVAAQPSGLAQLEVPWCFIHVLGRPRD